MLAASSGLALAGCAVGLGPPDRIIDLSSGKDLSADDLLAVLRRADHVLLGERHDNRGHHERRGRLIVSMGVTASVVAEHVERGRQVGYGADVLARLLAAGFDSKSWQWPLHEPLFLPVLRSGIRLVGGNLSRSLARQIARGEPGALPAELRDAIDAAPLSSAAQAALDRDLIEGHCGQLPADRLPSMRLAQRARDASMAFAMKANPGRPTVLVAGNGHVRKDAGVPTVLRQLSRHDTIVSVGFAEHGAGLAEQPYDFVWITPGVTRADPCAGFRMPTAAPTPA